MTNYRDKRDFIFTSERDRYSESAMVMEEEIAKNNIEREEIINYMGKTTTKLRIRKAPNTNSEIVKIVDKGTMLEYTIINNGWAHLTDGNYCMAEFLEK